MGYQLAGWELQGKDEAMKDRTRFLLQMKGQNTTKMAYQWHLDFIAKELPWPFTMDEYVKVIQRWGNAMQRVNLAALKAYLRWKGLDHPVLALIIPRDESPPSRTLKESQKDELLSLCPNTRMGKRNKAIICMLWDTCVRRSELAGAELRRLDMNNRTITLRTKATRGKPRGWETKKFSRETRRALDDWLVVHNTACRTIFNLTGDGIASMFKRLSKKAGFRVSPHDFRRGGITNAVEAGVPDRLVMHQAGLKTHSVFQRYSASASLKAYGKLMWGDS